MDLAGVTIAFLPCIMTQTRVLGRSGGGFEKPFKPDPLTYTPGTNVKLIHKAEYCKSIIADGKELITGNERGELVVPELKDPKVYITFKEDLTDFSDAFKSCSSLTTIPENLFANCPAVTSFQGTFDACTSLTAIPEGLFANNPKVTNFYGTFQSCTSLKSIPENLFANCPAVTDFFFTFSSCSALESIPEQLFANNPKVIDFGAIFSSCTFLKSIPENLFANCPAVTNFGSTFSNCYALATIPEKLFANCPKVTSFSRTFLACRTLKSVPAGLFDNNRKVTDFGSRFYGLFESCSALTGESPYTVIDGQKVHLYERANYPEHFTAPSNVQKTFRECYNLTDYNQIPSNWK